MVSIVYVGTYENTNSIFLKGVLGGGGGMSVFFFAAVQLQDLIWIGNWGKSRLTHTHEHIESRVQKAWQEMWNQNYRKSNLGSGMLRPPSWSGRSGDSFAKGFYCINLGTKRGKTWGGQAISVEESGGIKVINRDKQHAIGVC